MCYATQGRAAGHFFSAICLIHPEITIRKFLTLRCESSFVPAHSLSPGGHGTDRSRSSARGAQAPGCVCPAPGCALSVGKAPPDPVWHYPFPHFALFHITLGLSTTPGSDAVHRGQINSPTATRMLTPDRGAVRLCFLKLFSL